MSTNLGRTNIRAQMDIRVPTTQATMIRSLGPMVLWGDCLSPAVNAAEGTEVGSDEGMGDGPIDGPIWNLRVGSLNHEPVNASHTEGMWARLHRYTEWFSTTHLLPVPTISSGIKNRIVSAVLPIHASHFGQIGLECVPVRLIVVGRNNGRFVHAPLSVRCHYPP